MEGRKFTRVSDDGLKFSKLDRFLVSNDLGLSFKSLGVKTLERRWSDHYPIMLHIDKCDFGPKPFKFFDSWLNEEGLEEVVTNAWNTTIRSSRPDCVFRDKLKNVKEAVKKWSKAKFGNLERELKELKEAVVEKEKEAENLGWKDSEREVWIQKRKRWLELEEQKVGMMRQKAKLKWVVDGDENSKIFHAAIKFKERRNAIRGLNTNSGWTDNASEIKNHIFEFFKDKFSTGKKGGPGLRGDLFRKIAKKEAEFLERPFEEEEIWQAIKSCGNNKSPGPDGFTFGFVKRFWGIIKEDLVNGVRSFGMTGEISEGCNPSFLTLIPKVPNPISLGEYRPISLIGIFYKTIAKVMAERLKTVIGKIISDAQSAFIKGRSILDEVLVANEAVDFLKKKKKKALIFKVDFEKAYDSLDWEFLVDCMRKMGFGDRWTRWIETCLKSSTMSILINGSPTKEFRMGKGLRQGDPLAPFLFLIAAEGLHILLEQAENTGLFEGIKVGTKNIPLSHLQYADDIILFGKWSIGNLKNLIKVLKCFYELSGLKINLGKSKIYGIGVSMEEVKT